MRAVSRSRTHGAGLRRALGIGILSIGFGLSALAAGPALADGHGEGVRGVDDLKDLSIEDLSNLEVTSVSKRAEQLSQAPASAFVITNDDLRRTGVLTLPEALRLAPNLEVSRLDAASYAISSRGFNGFETSNKLLVLIDGRSVYTPLFGGVFWEAQTVPVEDLDRIEVVSGPGGALWGANAFNGVINVISRDAHDTQGGLFTAAAGDVDKRAFARFGGRFGESGAFRVYASGFDRGASELLAGGAAGDAWEGAQGGFRADWGGGRDRFTLQGDLYRDRLGTSAALSTSGATLRGGNLLGRWRRELDGGAGVEVQAYYDKTDRDSLVSDRLTTWDIEAQHTVPLGQRHLIVWGAGYRVTDDEFINKVNPFMVDPASRTITIGNVFAQDDITLRDDLSLTLGLKVEDSSYTGVAFMPSVRLAWQPSEGALWWGAVSRAVRTPSRIERELQFTGIVEPGTFDSEKVTAFEVGYRGRPTPRSTFSITVFHNLYTDIRTNEFAPGGVFPVHVDNSIEGSNTGVEAWGAFDVTDWWRLSLGASALGKDFHVRPGHTDLAGMLSIGNDPDYQLFARSQMDLGRWQLDVRLRAVDDLPKPAVDGYVEADAKLGWQLTKDVELGVVGQNLLSSDRQENGDPARALRVPRTVYASLSWSF